MTTPLPTPATTPCDDLLVIDLSSGQPGGIATMVLADFGADVIKVEPPGGDPARSEPAAPLWLRGKRSVELDLGTAEGQQALHRLVRGADVVVSSFAPGSAAAHGADDATLRALNPALVYCSITGWGPRGPYAGYPADEALVAAKSGRMRSFTGVVRREGPAFPAVQVGTHAAAQSAIAGILAALYAREFTGRGQLVETSLLQGMLPYDLGGLVREQMAARYPQHLAPDTLLGLQSPDAMPTLGYQPVRSADGRWIQFANLLEHLFHASIGALDLVEDVTANPRYAGAPSQLGEAEREEVRNLMLARASERTAYELMAAFRANGNVAADLVGTAQDALAHADLIANGEVVERADAELGAVRQLGVLAKLRATPGAAGDAPPAVGAHTAAVLAAPVRAPWTPREAPRTHAHALAGVTVLELATIIAAPLGASLLADLGARVIKIEPTDGGDPMRGMGGAGLGGQLFVAKTTASKESICIDLKRAEGRAIVARLVTQADVIVHNYRPGVPERLGIGYEQVRALRSGIVWVSVSGYGPDGPSATRPSAHPIPGAVDGGALMQAGAGWAELDTSSIDGLREASRRFYRANEANPDPNTSMAVVSATLLGLRTRQRTGEGQAVYVSMLGANAYANADDFLAYAGKPARPTLDGQLLGTGPLRRLYRARDGWVCLSAPGEAQWAALCLAIGRPELAADARFCDARARSEHGATLGAELAAAFLARDADEWERTLIAAGVGCVRADGHATAGAFLLNDPHVRANGFVRTTQHVVMGEYERWGPVVTLAETPGRYGPGVLAGQHTDALLAELDYDAGAVASLRSAGVVWSEQPLVL